MTGVSVAISHLAADWELAPFVFLAAGLAIALFGQALVRLRRRGRKDDVGPARALLFLAGVALATLALVSPLDRASEEYLLSAHMLHTS